MTTSKPIRSGAVLALALVLAGLAATLAPPAGASRAPAAAYGWPVRPFHVQHPVRGYFGDPRISRSASGGHVRQFHFGVDVAARNGTPVFATLTGTATIHPLHADVVLIASGSLVFSYWHIIPAIRPGTPVVAYRTVIGHIEKPWAHVHFSEQVNGVYVNPLRPGALGPYEDCTRPTIRAISIERTGDGRLDLVADVFDTTPLTVPPPWAGKPVMPAVVRWRVLGPQIASPAWRIAVDFRQTIPSASLFGSVYADGTRQNHASVQARYRVSLARGIDTRALTGGRYVIQVVAEDGHGNSTEATAGFTVPKGAY